MKFYCDCCGNEVDTNKEPWYEVINQKAFEILTHHEDGMDLTGKPLPLIKYVCSKCITKMENKVTTVVHPNHDLSGAIIDIFDEFLSKRGIKIPSSEEVKDSNGETDNRTAIYGDDYYELENQIEKILSKNSAL